MSSETKINCSRCQCEIDTAAVVCPNCQSLVHAERLQELSSEARKLEAKAALHEANERWQEALALLPPESKQALWIKDRSIQLGKTAEKLGLAHPQSEQSPIFNPKSAITFIAFILVGIQLYDLRFGIGFAALVLIHEMGHYVDIRFRGLPADMPVFLPGLGAFVRWRAMGVPLATRAFVSLAGPLAGLLSAAACVAIWSYTRDPLYYRLGQFGAGITLLNLVPVWVLDGGQAVRALSRRAKVTLLFVALLLCFVRGGSLFLAIVAGAVYQVFFNKESVPDTETERPSFAAALYFIALLPALALVLRILAS